MDLWYPQAKKAELPNSGDYLGGPARGVIHTTEGKTYAGAFAAYKSNGTPPHFTCSFEGNKFQVWQHVPLNKAAKALRNTSGGVQTNREFAIQIELVGTCNVANWGQPGWLYVVDFPMAYLNGIRDLMIWVETQANIQPMTSCTFIKYPDSYGNNNGVRMSNDKWDKYNGWCGHQHVPENLHGDPGLLYMQHLLKRVPTQPSNPQPEYEYSEGDVKTKFMSIGPLDNNGRGWVAWNPGLGLNPVPVGEPCQQGPYPPDDGYWDPQFGEEFRVQTRGEELIISVHGGKPNDTVSVFVSAAPGS